MAFEEDINALTSLCDVKRVVSSDPSDDALLVQLINRVSEKIELVTGRHFKARDYRFWLSPDCDRKIVLPQYPVIYINRIGSGSTQAMDVTYSGSGIRATVQVYRDETGEVGGVRLVSYDSSGTITANNLTVAANGSVSAMATAITAISDWTGTLIEDAPAADLHPLGGVDARSRTVSLTYPDHDNNEYRANYDNGIIELFEGHRFDFNDIRTSSSFQGFLVEARCGYETIPGDVASIAIDMVSQAFSSKGINRSLASENLGDYAYTLASNTQISDEQRGLLSSYLPLSIGGAA